MLKTFRAPVPLLPALLCLAQVLAAPPCSAVELSHGVVIGYDSFIDRFTIVEDDTSQSIHEFSVGLDNRLRYDRPALKFSLRNLFRYGNQMVDEHLEGVFSTGARARGLVQLRGDLRLKHFRPGSDYEFGNDYVQSNVYLKAGRRLAGRFFLFSRSRIEAIDYEERTEFDYDYRYLDTGIGIEAGSFFERFAAFSLSLGRRAVPDTTDLGYDRLLAACDGRLSSGSAHLELSVSADRRDYRGPARSSNWNVNSSAGAGVIGPGGSSWTLGLESELFLYDLESRVYFNNHYLRAGLRAKLPASEVVSVFIEPRLGRLYCAAFEEERYVEGSIVFGFDALSGRRYWVSVAYEPGYRDYLLEDNYIYSDFHLNRLSLMGSASVGERLSLTLFVSHDPERHRRRTDNFSLTLVSASLSLLF